MCAFGQGGGWSQMPGWRAQVWFNVREGDCTMTTYLPGASWESFISFTFISFLKEEGCLHIFFKYYFLKSSGAPRNVVLRGGWCCKTNSENVLVCLFNLKLLLLVVKMMMTLRSRVQEEN